MGSIVLVWSVLRIRDPQPRLGRYDAAGRLLFSAWMAWALAVTGEPLIWLFLLPEAAWCIVQCLPVRRPPSGGVIWTTLSSEEVSHGQHPANRTLPVV